MLEKIYIDYDFRDQCVLVYCYITVNSLNSYMKVVLFIM